MFFFLIQTFFLFLLFFVLGAACAWLLVRALYRPVEDVRLDLNSEFPGGAR